MKKNLFLAALAVVALASCSDDNFVGNNSPDNVITTDTDAISFGSFSKGLTRADHYGKDAATMLSNKFIVGGYKGNSTAMTTVFSDYLVQYTENTAATTESNTSDWEYVGYLAPASSQISGNKQTIKFWDYSTDQYDFIAYSTGAAGAQIPGSGLGDNNVRVMTIDYANKATKAYSLGGSRQNLAKCYIADMVSVYKNGADPLYAYQNEVPLTFRNLATKVRVALYETVPGYSVKDVKFYTTDAANNTDIATGASETKVTLFTSGSDTKDNFYTNGTFNVYFPTTGETNISNSDYNKAHVSFVPNASTTTQDFGALNYTGEEQNEAVGNVYLGRNLPNATYAGGDADHYYTIMLPNEEGTVLELRIDYTLLATDGSGEEIKIHGAKAFVPAIYATWKPNYAYTYVFKISDNTNGWTNTDTTEPAGLYPITFDAVVVDAEEYQQSTITSVTTPSITTYQLGHDPEHTDEYSAANGTIYISAMVEGNPKTDIGSKGYLYKVTNESENTTLKLEANVMDALNIQKSVDGNNITGYNGLILTRQDLYYATTIPGVDGNDLVEGTDYPQYSTVRFAPEKGTYAFCYRVSQGTETPVLIAETLATAPTGWPTDWFKDAAGTQAAPTTFAPGNYYKKRYTNKNDVWAVKVIIVDD